MRTLLLSVVAFPFLYLVTPATAQEKGGDDRTGPYDVALGWPLPLPDKGYIWGSTGGIFAETPDRVFIANRGELKLPEKLPRNFTGFLGSLGEQATSPTPLFKNCINIVDANGKLTHSYLQSRLPCSITTFSRTIRRCAAISRSFGRTRFTCSSVSTKVTMMGSSPPASTR
jgi:hypothetical protein